MHIHMTRGTILRRAFIDSVLMTLLTGHIDMLANQRESSGVVIKGGVLPICRSMAFRAIVSKLPIVRIHLFMAGEAIPGCAFI